jgi:hypothetical protein
MPEYTTSLIAGLVMNPRKQTGWWTTETDRRVRKYITAHTRALAAPKAEAAAAWQEVIFWANAVERAISWSTDAADADADADAEPVKT